MKLKDKIVNFFANRKGKDRNCPNVEAVKSQESASAADVCIQESAAKECNAKLQAFVRSSSNDIWHKVEVLEEVEDGIAIKTSMFASLDENLQDDTGQLYIVDLKHAGQKLVEIHDGFEPKVLSQIECLVIRPLDNSRCFEPDYIDILI